MTDDPDTFDLDSLEHVKTVLKDIKRVYPGYDSDNGYTLAGFVWFQGWNDYCQWRERNADRAVGAGLIEAYPAPLAALVALRCGAHATGVSLSVSVDAKVETITIDDDHELPESAAATSVS